MKIIIYHTNFIRIGGVETFTFNMCKNLSKFYDVELIYKTIHQEQLARFQKIVKCTNFDSNKKYDCDILILSSSWGGYPENIISSKNEYWQMIHANYKELLKTGYKYEGWKKTTKHIAVSKSVAENFKEIYGIDCEIIYNILDEKVKTKPLLKLVSATRLSREKGYDRMVQLANALKKNNIKFRWTIFTDLQKYPVQPMNMEEVIFMKCTYDIFDYIKEADYGVQLSDTEGYSYFVNECLQYGTPMLVTSFDSAFESVKDGVSGYILDFKLFEENKLESVLDKIVNKIPKKFVYTPKSTVQNWIDILGEPDKKETYVYKEQKHQKNSDSECIVNLFDKYKLVDNYYYTAPIGKGIAICVENNNFFLSDYIPCEQGKTYTHNRPSNSNQAFFDKGKNLVRFVPSSTICKNMIIPYPNDFYFRVYCSKNEGITPDTWQIKEVKY